MCVYVCVRVCVYVWACVRVSEFVCVRVCVYVLPKRVMFGELPATRPRRGPRKRRRGIIMEDLDRLAPPVPADKWYATAQDCPAWRRVAPHRPLPRVVDGPEFRCVCGKICHRSGDLKRPTPFCRVASR